MSATAVAGHVEALRCPVSWAALAGEWLPRLIAVFDQTKGLK